MMISRHGEWLSATVGDQLMMMSTEKGQYVGLTAVGARIWALLEVPHSLEQICAALEIEFDVDPAVCRTEVESFLKVLEAQGAVTCAADEAA